MWPESLRRVEVTRPSLEENLAEDLALLQAAGDDPSAATLRFWELSSYAVIVGRSNDIDCEVDVAACHADDVPIVRRASGGGAVVLGPGCLCFTLALPIPAEFAARGIAGITQELMHRLAAALSTPAQAVSVRGISDLAVGDRKVCGNAQRWTRTAFLHHGSLLYDFDLPRIGRYLNHPTREPNYRTARPHHEFIANLTLPRVELVRRLSEAWRAVPH